MHDRFFNAGLQENIRYINDKFAHDIAATFIGRHNAVTQTECHRPDMIGHDTGFLGRQCHVFRRSGAQDRSDDRDKKIRFKIIMFALHDRGQTFQAHAGINVLRRQRLEHTAFLAIVLREDQVPHLTKTAAAAIRITIRVFTAIHAPVKEDL